MTMMIKQIAVVWSKGGLTGEIQIQHGVLQSTTSVQPATSHGFAMHASEDRLLLEIACGAAQRSNPTLVTILSSRQTFSFFLRDVNARFPIYVPAYGVAVTTGEDDRRYAQIEQEIRRSGRLTRLQQIEQGPEETYQSAASHTRELTCQTWLGLSRDIRIFGAGFRGVGNVDQDGLIWDWVQPRYHGYEASQEEASAQRLIYAFMIGRGVGPVQAMTRRLDEGILPILHGTLNDDEVSYETTCFVTLETSALTIESLRGTHYLVADGYGHGHMLTAAQAAERRRWLNTEMNPSEETVFYMRIVATNTGDVPRYAWFKNPVPMSGAPLRVIESGYQFDVERGYVQHGDGHVCTVSLLDGNPLDQEESAVLLLPGESVQFEFRIPHRPISVERATLLAAQSFEKRLSECRVFWKKKLASAATLTLPEKRIEEMVKAGLLHLDLVTYGHEPIGTLVPTIGVYTAIGSESAPIMQVVESMGWHEQAARSLQYFLDKQHEDGFIQNFNGYMLETGAALWQMGEHYRYTRDDSWLAARKDQLLLAYDCLVAWRNRNKDEALRGYGYGMLEGKTADPEDPYHSFMLNGYAYLGMHRLAEMLRDLDPSASESIAKEAAALKRDIRAGFFHAMSRSPLIPLGDGSWIPTAPPWMEDQGPLCLYAKRANWVTHGTVTTRDSLLGPLYLVFQEVLAADEVASGFLLESHLELMCTRNVAFSQPYYSIHPFVHLQRGEVKAFLKAYYNGFAGLADRHTYTFWEHYWHCSPHKTHEEGWFLLQTRQMLYREAGASLFLLPGIPRSWLADGQQIELDKAASYFGQLFLSVRSDLTHGKVYVTLRSDASRLPAEVQMRIPHPQGKRPCCIEGQVVHRIDNDRFLLKHYQGHAELVFHYR